MSQYLIAYNNTQGFNPGIIHQVITGIPSMIDWWHYLPNFYIISTHSNAQYISNQISSQFQGLLFIVIKLDMVDYSGVLGKDAWDWIANKNNQKVKLRSVTTTSTSSSLPPLLRSFLAPLPPRTTNQSAFKALNEILKAGRR